MQEERCNWYIKFSTNMFMSLLAICATNNPVHSQVGTRIQYLII